MVTLLLTTHPPRLRYVICERSLTLLAPINFALEKGPLLMSGENTGVQKLFSNIRLENNPEIQEKTKHYPIHLGTQNKFWAFKVVNVKIEKPK